MADVTLKAPTQVIWDERLPEKDRQMIEDLNNSVSRLNEMRAVEINISGPFARSKIAWKLATYQHALLHRIIDLADGVALTFNAKSTLSAMLSARAIMETVAVFTELETRVASLLAKEDLGGLDGLAQHGLFASRDEEWIKEFPETKATNVLTYINKFDKRAEGFRGHYDRLSERCHPNSLGHRSMFSTLDRTEGSIKYSDEREPAMNAHTIIAALIPLLLLESMSTSLTDLVFEVADLQHRLAPVGGISSQGA
jgi:hypothetical protein